MRYAFSMIELIFVIIIIGILGAVALPRLGSTIDDAQLASAKSDLSSIRSAIILEKNKNLLQGKGSNYPDLNGTSTNLLFSGLSNVNIKAQNASGKWRRDSLDTDFTKFIFKLGDTDVKFTYDKSKGTFTCKKTDTYCKDFD